MEDVKYILAATLKVRDVTSVAFDPRGKYLASGFNDIVMVLEVGFPSAPPLGELLADEAADVELPCVQSKS